MFVFLVPSEPRAFKLTLTDPDSPVVEVNWAQPRFTYGQLGGYRLTFGVKGETATEDRRFDPSIYRYTTSYLGN